MNSQEDQDHREDREIRELIRALESRDGVQRQDAREALVKLGKRAVPALIAALSDEREAVRWEAAKTLTGLPDRRAAGPLVTALDDEDFDVRWLAAEALVVLQEKALAPLLEALTERGDSTELREGAHHVLKNLDGRSLESLVEPVIAALEHTEPELAAPLAAEKAAEIWKQRDSNNA